MLNLDFKEVILKFVQPIRTSRGSMAERRVWIVSIKDLKKSSTDAGVGEAAPLDGLSSENIEQIPSALNKIQEQLTHFNLPENQNECLDLAKTLAADFPSIRFALECALLELLQGGHRMLFPSHFTLGRESLPINGLIWMGETEFMKKQIDQKLQDGYSCIKLKIGGLKLDDELQLINYLRNKSEKVLIRLDANGAFRPENAMEKILALSQFDIHSLEQPIKRGQRIAMAELIAESPIPIALDEELIGTGSMEKKHQLLRELKPPFLVLKPSLLGGFRETSQWISLADQSGLKWWITSALESNIGLNAIAQFTATQNNNLHHGLGTGLLYDNNTPAMSSIEKGRMKYISN